MSLFDGSNKVVNLMSSGDDAVIPHEFQQMEGYWHALRGAAGGALPNRAQVDPRGLSSILASTLLLERVATGEVKVRLGGSAVHDVLGMDMRGMCLSALVAPASRDEFIQTLEAIFERPAIAKMQLGADGGLVGLIRGNLLAHLLILPLIGPSGKVDRAMACLVARGKAARSPRKLELLSAALEVIDFGAAPKTNPKTPAWLQAITTGQTEGARAPQQQYELAEDAHGFDHAPRKSDAELDQKTGKPRPSYLRLVKR